jgi:hypothetical protein
MNFDQTQLAALFAVVILGGILMLGIIYLTVSLSSSRRQVRKQVRELQDFCDELSFLNRRIIREAKQKGFETQPGPREDGYDDGFPGRPEFLKGISRLIEKMPGGNAILKILLWKPGD